jgi:protein involved in polysaccharide export with SLBB domain
MQAVMTIVVVVAVVVAGGCGPTITIPPLKSEDIARLDAAGNFPHRDYVIEAGDTLQIRYTFHQELNQDVVVRPDGKVTVHQIGDVEVAGFAPAALEVELVRRSSARLRSPEIVVSISKFSEKTVYVGGEVGKPGSVAYRRGLTPLQAIIAVGGFKEGARLDTVVLVRSGGQGDRFISRTLNLTDVVAKGEPESVQLAPQDVIYVPRTPIADANIWVKQHITEMLPFFRGASMPLPLY